MEVQNQKKAIPMETMIMENLRDNLFLDISILEVIQSSLEKIIHGWARTQDIEKVETLSWGTSRLIDYWIEGHKAEIDRTAEQFENMDLILLHSARGALEFLEKEHPPKNWREERLNDALEGLEAILQNPDLAHEEALQLKARLGPHARR